MSGSADNVPTINRNDKTIQRTTSTRVEPGNDAWDTAVLSDALETTSVTKVTTSVTKSSSSYAKVASKAKTKPIPDDWDDEDDNDDDEVDPVTVWQEANTKSPMPEVILNNASSIPNPPQEILAAPLRILKRPSTNPQSDTNISTNGGDGLSSATERLREREAAYQVARARIFGETSSNDDASTNLGSDVAVTVSNKIQFRPRTSQQTSSSSLPTASSVNTGSPSILRNPYGPISSEPSLGNTVAQGFGNGTGHTGGGNGRRRGGGKQNGNKRNGQSSSGGTKS